MQYIMLEIQPSPCTHGLGTSTLFDDECNSTAVGKVLLHCAVAFVI